MIRLQGKEFAQMRPNLRFVKYIVSRNGNIRVHLRHKDDTVVRYYHWLNPAEKERFMKSKYWKVENSG